MTDWTPPDKRDTPADFGIPRGCVCVKCGSARACDRGEMRDHRFTCNDCLAKRKR
jgi:hypothetical protein